MQEDNIEELYKHILETRTSLTRPYNRDIVDEKQQEVGDIVLSYEVLKDVPFRVTRIGKDGINSEEVKDGWYNTLLLMDRALSEGNTVYTPEGFKEDVLHSIEKFNCERLELDELTATKSANYLDHYTEDLELSEEHEIENQAVNNRMRKLVDSVPEDATLVTLYSGIRNLETRQQINTPLGALSASIGTRRDIGDVGETFHESLEEEHSWNFIV